MRLLVIQMFLCPHTQFDIFKHATDTCCVHRFAVVTRRWRESGIPRGFVSTFTPIRRVDVRFPVSDGLNGTDVFNLFFRLEKCTDQTHAGPIVSENDGFYVFPLVPSPNEHVVSERDLSVASTGVCSSTKRLSTRFPIIPATGNLLVATPLSVRSAALRGTYRSISRPVKHYVIRLQSRPIL